MPAFSRARPVRRARIPAALVLLGGLVAGLYGFSHGVEVVVDGETVHDVRTYADTVGDVLETLDVEVGSADMVTPSPRVALTDGLVIDVERAITVDVEVEGGVARRVTAAVDRVGDVLETAGMDDLAREGARVRPALSAPVEDGDVVRVDLPTTIWVAVDGEEVQLTTHASHAQQALDEAGVDLGLEDIVVGGRHQPLIGPTTIMVRRVDTDTVVEEVALPHARERRETDDLLEGTERVDREGRDGLRRDTYEVTLVDGRETERDLVSQDVVEEPRDEVVLVGTGEPPPPEPAQPRTASISQGSAWDALARCESGGNWSHRSGSYHGGLQFHPDTWRAHKPSGYPTYAYQASREQQIEVGRRVQRSQGWSAWPHCSRVVGLR